MVPNPDDLGPVHQGMFVHVCRPLADGEKVSEQLDRLITLRGAPESTKRPCRLAITSDNGSEFTGKAMDLWAHQAGVKLNFIRKEC